MHQQRQKNSGSWRTNGEGNRIKRRCDVVPATLGSSPPTPRVGNLNGSRCNIVPDSMASTQPAPRVGNLNIHSGRRDVVPDPIGSESGMQADESGSSKTLLTAERSRRSQSRSLGETGVQARQPERP